jgi:hypothetical protein
MAAVGPEFEFDVTSNAFPSTSDPQAAVEYIPDQWIFTNLGGADVKVSFGPHLGDDFTIYGSAPGNQPPSVFTKFTRLWFRLAKAGAATKVRAVAIKRW